MSKRTRITTPDARFEVQVRGSADHRWAPALTDDVEASRFNTRAEAEAFASTFLALFECEHRVIRAAGPE